MDIPKIYLKDKQAWKKEKGIMQIMGKAVDVCKNLAKEQYKLVHILDMDAKKGMYTNSDVYDTLTYFIHVQVEGFLEEKIIDKLLSYDVRVVIELPAKIQLLKWENKQKFLVGRVLEKTEIPKEIGDVIVSTKELLEWVRKEHPKKRIIWDGKEKMQKVFGTIMD